MGICYSEEQQWEAYHKEIREKRRNRKKKRNASIIYEENSVYENSFASRVENSFREDIFQSISNILFESGSIITGGGSSLAMGSLVEMSEEEIKLVFQNLPKINANAELLEMGESVTLCNLKTKNFMHTHKVSFPDLPKHNEVSCCPSNANHIIEYDIWKFIKTDCDQSEAKSQSETSESHHQNQQSYYIFHPFTKKYLNFKKDHIVCTDEKKEWKIISYGPMRKGGFVKIVCEEGELCMTEERGLLSNHKKLQLCSHVHVEHLWELRFGEIL